MSNLPIISQTKLNVLQERVCRPIQYLTVKRDSATPLWDGPLNWCQQIETDYFAVDSVIMEARKNNIPFNGTNIPFYKADLCRVYILLYYLHPDDTAFKEIVFPSLLENMGIFSSKYQNDIKERIDQILEHEQLVEKVQAEKKKAVKPVFEYVAHNRDEMDNLFIEYSEEPLFRNMSEVIKYLSNLYGTNQDEANVWFNAKRVVHTLRDVKRPELLIERAATALVAGQIYNGYKGSQIILLCAYTMIRASENNAHFVHFIKKMESLSDNELDTDLTVIKNSIKAIKNMIDEQTFDGYNYIGEENSKPITYTNADIERIRKQFAEKEKELHVLFTKQIENYKKQIDILQGQLTERATRLPSVEKQEILIELLKPIFFDDENNVKDFIDRISKLQDSEITDLVYDWTHLTERNISDKSCNKDLWKILHAFKYYSSTSSNWNTALRNHPPK